MPKAVSLAFFKRLDNVDISFDSRSIAICRRSDSISPISLSVSSLSLTCSTTAHNYALLINRPPGNRSVGISLELELTRFG